MLVFAPLMAVDLGIWRWSASTPVRVLWLAISSTTGLLYSVLLHGFWGQTVGKRMMGIRVVDVSGCALKMKQAVLRDSIWIAFWAWGFPAHLGLVLRGINPYAASNTHANLMQSASTALFFVELVTMRTNSKRRALHAFLAGSVVIRVRKRRRLRPAG
jgi:uncharacterized RDD family membrane protein YckC